MNASTIRALSYEDSISFSPFKEFRDAFTQRLWGIPWPASAPSETTSKVDDAIRGRSIEDLRNKTIKREEDSTFKAKVDSMATAALSELEEYLLFSKGWDGYRAPPFEKMVVQTAQLIVLHVADWMKRRDVTPREITPGPVADGAIDVEFGFASRHVIVTIEPERDAVSFRLYTEDEHRTNEETFGPSLAILGKKFAEVFR